MCLMIIASLLIHAFGIVLGFYLCTLILPPLKHDEIENESDILFEYEYVDELEELIDSKKEESPVIKTNITTLDIDILNNKVIMYYDVEREAFCYYTKGDIIYKYLNVVCRKYVIDYNCPSLYHEDTSRMSVPEQTSEQTLFVKKVERPVLNKNINKFILCGSLEDYKNTQSKPVEKDITFLDYMSHARY